MQDYTKETLDNKLIIEKKEKPQNKEANIISSYERLISSLKHAYDNFSGIDLEEKTNYIKY